MLIVLIKDLINIIYELHGYSIVELANKFLMSIEEKPIGKYIDHRESYFSDRLQHKNWVGRHLEIKIKVHNTTNPKGKKIV